MILKVLAVGDVVGTPGLDRISRSLRFLKRKTQADLVIINGENASGTGITPQQAEDILDAGADLITLGNHSFNRREIVSYLDDCPLILRPANYAPQTPGRGWTVLETKCGPVAIIDLIGRCGMDFGPDNPFLLVEKLLKEIDTKVILVELHAEATSEKLAMGYMLDGKISALWGTHTHVPTADTTIFPGGTAFQCDAGMVGAEESVLGRHIQPVLDRFTTGLPSRFTVNDEGVILNGIVVTVDSETGKATAVERIMRK